MDPKLGELMKAQSSEMIHRMMWFRPGLVIVITVSILMINCICSFSQKLKIDFFFGKKIEIEIMEEIFACFWDNVKCKG